MPLPSTLQRVRGRANPARISPSAAMTAFRPHPTSLWRPISAGLLSQGGTRQRMDKAASAEACRPRGPSKGGAYVLTPRLRMRGRASHLLADPAFKGLVVGRTSGCESAKQLGDRSFPSSTDRVSLLSELIDRRSRAFGRPRARRRRRFVSRASPSTFLFRSRLHRRDGASLATRD